MDKEVKKFVISTGNVVAALAVAISWSLHKSILWALVHGCFGIFYIIYYACTR